MQPEVVNYKQTVGWDQPSLTGFLLGRDDAATQSLLNDCYGRVQHYFSLASAVLNAKEDQNRSVFSYSELGSVQLLDFFSLCYFP